MKRIRKGIFAIAVVLLISLLGQSLPPISQPTFAEDQAGAAAQVPLTYRYQDELGNRISPDVVKMVDDGSIQPISAYAVATIGQYELIDNFSDGPDGYFVSSQQENLIVYTYRLKNGGKVHVKHVDENGRELATTDTLIGSAGDTYRTSPKTIENYDLLSVTGAAEGTYTANQEVTVTYTYRLKADVTILKVRHIQESSGEEIAISEEYVKLGTSYTTEALNDPDFSLKRVEGQTSGQISDKETLITYYYTSNLPAKVTVYHVNPRLGKDAPFAVEELTGQDGTPYQTSAKDIPTVVFYKSSSNTSGIFISGQDIEVIYEYIKPVNLTINYYDNAGNVLQPSITVTRNDFDISEYVPQTIGDYEHYYTQAPPEGDLPADPYAYNTDYTYYAYYRKIPTSQVTIKYVDDSGNELEPEESLTGKVGETYSVSAKAIPGYELVKTEGAESGAFGSSNTAVTYTYRAVTTTTTTTTSTTTSATTTAETSTSTSTTATTTAEPTTSSTATTTAEPTSSAASTTTAEPTTSATETTVESGASAATTTEVATTTITAEPTTSSTATTTATTIEPDTSSTETGSVNTEVMTDKISTKLNQKRALLPKTGSDDSLIAVPIGSLLLLIATLYWHQKRTHNN
ncbi:MucBP domain-containing protein [Streptococcus ferus]|uniref:Internalin, putative (LPXTG motif) n=1 Tax=Streptococcus ferus TaxID=1345 RepID=A0A2X3VP57_9STRE|nr:MucBP domain-containing protein [Streptococcus ferus]SQF41208.1 internalin, putative (LPXTG motif) [Streptococcus ferus]